MTKTRSNKTARNAASTSLGAVPPRTQFQELVYQMNRRAGTTESHRELVADLHLRGELAEGDEGLIVDSEDGGRIGIRFGDFEEPVDASALLRNIRA